MNRTEDELSPVEFSKPMYTRNIGVGALTLVKSLEDRIREVLGEDYA